MAKKTIKSVKPQKSLSTDQIKDQISELRMEMTRCVAESTSVSILGLLLFIGAPSVFPEIINPYLPSSLQIMQAIIALPTLYWAVTMLGNMTRHFRIMKLQDALSSK